MIRTHTITKKNPQHNQEWSWEETPELKQALEKLHESSQLAASFQKGKETPPEATSTASSEES
jgi:hypothetical protein|tara:strand:- start:170 stop:358 length:189 start_codon:yes stop_codon:yes gene_type:complete